MNEEQKLARSEFGGSLGGYSGILDIDSFSPLAIHLTTTTVIVHVIFTPDCRCLPHRELSFAIWYWCLHMML